MVGIEALIFGGQNSVDDVPRHVFQREFVTESLGDACFAEWDAVAIQERDALDWRMQESGRNWDQSERKFDRDQQRRQRRDN
jgi:hypothetical protein